jgi:copper chaperone
MLLDLPMVGTTTFREGHQKEITMYEFHIPTMACGGCRNAVEQAIKSADASALATIDPTSKRVQVQTALHPAIIGQAIERAGYPVTASQF